MKTNHVRQTVFPLVAALIWGTAFVAQSVGAEYVEPFTFNAARFAVAAVVLGAGLALYNRLGPKGEAKPEEAQREGRRELLWGGLSCGVALAVAANLQQAGIQYTTAGKASFVTALYIVLVPIFGLFLHKKVAPAVWVSVGLAVLGLYFICVKEGFSITVGDFLVLLCAFCFTAHILLIDHFTQRVSGVALSCAQFAVAAAVSGVGVLLWEQPSLAGLQASLIPILYVGIFSSGVAYTLQILAQKDSNPTVVCLLLSLEAVFGALAGAVVLQERMSGREYSGCALMLAAVVLAQIPLPRRREKSTLQGAED